MKNNIENYFDWLMFVDVIHYPDFIIAIHEKWRSRKRIKWNAQARTNTDFNQFQSDTTHDSKLYFYLYYVFFIF